MASKKILSLDRSKNVLCNKAITDIKKLQVVKKSAGSKSSSYQNPNEAYVENAQSDLSEVVKKLKVSKRLALELEGILEEEKKLIKKREELEVRGQLLLDSLNEMKKNKVEESKIQALDDNILVLEEQLKVLDGKVLDIQTLKINNKIDESTLPNLKADVEGYEEQIKVLERDFIKNKENTVGSVEFENIDIESGFEVTPTLVGEKVEVRIIKMDSEKKESNQVATKVLVSPGSWTKVFGGQEGQQQLT